MEKAILSLAVALYKREVSAKAESVGLLNSCSLHPLFGLSP